MDLCLGMNASWWPRLFWTRRRGVIGPASRKPGSVCSDWRRAMRAKLGWLEGWLQDDHRGRGSGQCDDTQCGRLGAGLEDLGEPEHVIHVRVRGTGGDERRPRQEEFGCALVAEILFSPTPRVVSAASCLRAAARLHEVGVDDAVRAAEALPPVVVCAAHSYDEVPAVPHDRLGLLLVKNRDPRVTEGGEHFEVHWHGRPGGIDEIRAQPGYCLGRVAPAVPGEEGGDSGVQLSRQVSSSVRLVTMVS